VKAVFYIHLCEEHKWPNHYSQVETSNVHATAMTGEYSDFVESFYCINGENFQSLLLMMKGGFQNLLL